MIRCATKINNYANEVMEIPVDEYERLCIKTKSMYEQIPDDQPVSLYADLDLKNKDLMDGSELYDCTMQLIDIAKRGITDAIASLGGITPPRFANKIATKIDGSNPKLSFHIIVTNYKMLKIQQGEFFKSVNRIIDTYRDDKWAEDFLEMTADRRNAGFFDMSVYSKGRKMRSPFCTKEGENRPFLISEGTFRDCIISIPATDAQELHIDIPEKKTPVVSAVSVTGDNAAEKYCDYMSLIPATRWNSYMDWFKIQRASANLGIPFDVYDKFMRPCTSYDRDNNQTVYEMPSDDKNGRLGWKYIYDAAYESNPKAKMEIDKKWREVEDKEFRHADDDKTAARMIIEDLKDTLVYSFKRIFIKKDNVWICDPNAVKNHIFVFTLNSNIKKRNAKGEWTSYAQNNRTATAITTNVISILKDESISNDDFYYKLHTTTKGRVCFKDGVLDFAKRRFYKWNDIDFEYYTPVMIHYNFEEHFNNPDRKLGEEIREDVFRPLFGDKTSLALQFLSRAICGHSEDKNWASLLGKRNNGKGVIFDGLSNAFEEYVRAFELENLLYQRKREDITESSRKNAWLLDLEWTRLAITQEIPDPKSGLLLNGKKTKKIQSGGDIHHARRNYDTMDTQLILELTLLIMGNNSIVPDDEDVMEKCIEFSTSLQFKSQIEINMMREEYKDMPLMLEGIRVENPHLKTLIKTDKWRNAIIMLLYDYYSPTRISVERKRENVEMNTLRGRILEIYEVTRNESDLIPVKEVADRLDETLRKISNELEGIGVKKKKPTAGLFKNVTCFIGLKKIVTENPVESMDGDDECK